MKGTIVLRRDLTVAILLALGMSAAWCFRHWADLAMLQLPDTDDVMRLQQVRDWMAGQAFGDLHQYRLGGPGGVAMHWSRLPDLPIAALIALSRPIFGQNGAELLALIVWPATLFATCLALIAAIARRLAVGSVPAIVVAALAYPATTLFVPGRIDHHGLQIVLLLACVHGMVAPPARWRGAAIGAAMAASAAIGFELLAALAVIAAWALVEWLRGDDARFEGMVTGLLAVGAASLGLVPASAPEGLCDALTTPTAALIVACGSIGLMMTIAARHRVSRPIVAIGGGLAAAVAAAVLARSCGTGPYGAVDPLVATLWLSGVAEAQSIATAPIADTIGYTGLATAGLLAALWHGRREGGAWWGVSALIGTALLVAVWQLRGVYPGAALAPLALARLIDLARARGAAPLAGAWLISAGTLYPVAAQATAPDARGTVAACDSEAVIAALRRVMPGRVAAPIDLAPAIIARTAHTALAGPYHRNNAGNAAMYRIYLGTPAEARAAALALKVDYIVVCPGAVSSPANDRSIARTARGAPHLLRAATGSDR